MREFYARLVASPGAASFAALPLSDRLEQAVLELCGLPLDDAPLARSSTVTSQLMEHLIKKEATLLSSCEVSPKVARLAFFAFTTLVIVVHTPGTARGRRVGHEAAPAPTAAFPGDNALGGASFSPNAGFFADMPSRPGSAPIGGVKIDNASSYLKGALLSAYQCASECGNDAVSSALAVFFPDGLDGDDMGGGQIRRHRQAHERAASEFTFEGVMGALKKVRDGQCLLEARGCSLVWLRPSLPSPPLAVPGRLLPGARCAPPPHCECCRLRERDANGRRSLWRRQRHHAALLGRRRAHHAWSHSGPLAGGGERV